MIKVTDRTGHTSIVRTPSELKALIAYLGLEAIHSVVDYSYGYADVWSSRRLEQLNPSTATE